MSHDMIAYDEEYKNDECTHFNGYMLWNIYEAEDVNFINSYFKRTRSILFFLRLGKDPVLVI